VRPSKNYVQCAYDKEDNLILYRDEGGKGVGGKGVESALKGVESAFDF
jgi:hypothetical protein